ncbi:uncharacterized protein LOC129547678 [Moschus berezovskii]|uniref:uncharacterized protein LOC129547678 n=1 Tax=Moschus berezovskii TaxID=68408 RepID=UPI002444CA33|nr:uncharacterized protein LOC129547678 [Moschus berezovskii]
MIQRRQHGKDKWKPPWQFRVVFVLKEIKPSRVCAEKQLSRWPGSVGLLKMKHGAPELEISVWSSRDTADQAEREGSEVGKEAETGPGEQRRLFLVSEEQEVTDACLPGRFRHRCGCQSTDSGKPAFQDGEIKKTGKTTLRGKASRDRLESSETNRNDQGAQRRGCSGPGGCGSFSGRAARRRHLSPDSGAESLGGVLQVRDVTAACCCDRNVGVFRKCCGSQEARPAARSLGRLLQRLVD